MNCTSIGFDCHIFGPPHPESRKLSWHSCSSVRGCRRHVLRQSRHKNPHVLGINLLQRSMHVVSYGGPGHPTPLPPFSKLVSMERTGRGHISNAFTRGSLDAMSYPPIQQTATTSSTPGPHPVTPPSDTINHLLTREPLRVADSLNKSNEPNE